MNLTFQLISAALALVTTARAELKLTAHWPAGGNACLDTPLRLTFASPPVLGSTGKLEILRATDDAVIDSIDLSAPTQVDRFGANGGVMLRYEPVLIDGHIAEIRLHAHLLKPTETYRVRISPGFFQDFADLAEPWTFRTRAAMPRNPDRVVVASDGAGDFCTIQGAVDQIEPHRDAPAEIFVRNGAYHEMVRIGRERRRIHLLGEDRQRTVLACINNDKLNSGWIQRAVLGCEADDFVLENMTVQNTTAYRGSQAEAVTINAERCILRRANFLSFQDTLDLSGRVYVADCYVEGDVDFVWGYGTALFERCELKTMHDGFVVQARNPPSRPGYVFVDCKLTAAPEVKKVWLARIEPERFPASYVSFIRCAMAKAILPAGWQITGKPGDALRFEEFASTDESGQALDISKRDPGAKQITEAQARERLETTLLGSDQWRPRERK
jgi:pectin methylesterase-like acyl-CoA thioesterase